MTSEQKHSVRPLPPVPQYLPIEERMAADRATKATKLTIDLGVVHPFPEDTYHLLVCGARDDGSSHATDNVSQATAAAQARLDLKFRYDSHHPPRQLHFYLFVKRRESHGLLVEQLLCTGEAPFISHASFEVSLMDVKGNEQATLLMHGWAGEPSGIAEDTTTTTTTSTTSSSSAVALFGAAIQNSRVVYKSLRTPSIDAILMYVVTPSGYRMPVLDFVASLGPGILRLDQAAHDSQCAEQLLWHHYQIAARNVGMAKSFQETPHLLQAEFISEMFTLMPRALLYHQDVVRVNDSEESPCDQWVHLLTFPNLECAAYDCEDSTLLVLQLLHLARRATFRRAELIQLQQCLARYTACFVIGSLKRSHAYALLVDSNWLDGTKAAKHAPAILLEGTARINGCGDDRRSDHLAESSIVHSAVLHRLPCDVALDKAIRNEAALEVAQANNIYGRVYGLIAADHRGSAVHLALVDPSNENSVGVPLSAVMRASTELTRTVVQTFPAGSRDALYADLPHTSIPLVTAEMEAELAHQLQAAPRSPAAFHIDIQAQTYCENCCVIEAVIECVCKEEGYRIASKQMVQLTSTLSVQQVWVEPM